MAVNSQQLRSEQHIDIGALIQRDRGIVIERWRRRAVEEQPQAQRAHLDVILDRFDAFLWALGASLAETHDVASSKHRIVAVEHGEQRWQHGWSLPELVRDFQLMRITLMEHLEETLERHLRSREVMAIGLALDEAIAASVGMYVASREEYIRRIERERAERDKQAEEERVRERAQALQKENERKDEFLATLGHELRNPLGPIRNAIHVLNVRAPDMQTLQWAKEVVERQVRHMTRLVDELLEVTRINQGKVKLQLEDLDMTALMAAVVGDYGNAANEAGINLQWELPSERILVRGDTVRLTQIVGNLLHNALKFTDRGGQVTVHLAADREKKQAGVTIEDTGIGIEADMLSQVFETFRQADSSPNRTRGGLGVGLAVVKSLVELHGGEVRVASAGPGRGSVFTVWIPLGQASAPIP